MPNENESNEGGKNLKSRIHVWSRDVIEVMVTLAVIIIILKVLFGANMIVPLVVVTSGSMVHHEADNSWMHWMNQREIGNDTIAEMTLLGGFNMGDMILVQRPDAQLGDVIIYNRDYIYGSPTMEPIIHRVVGVVYVSFSEVVKVEGTLDCLDEGAFTKYIKYVEACQSGIGNCYYPGYPDSGEYKFYITKGDANPSSDQCAGQNIAIPVNEGQVPAKTMLRLPYVGWLKLILNYIIKLLTLQI